MKVSLSVMILLMLLLPPLQAQTIKQLFNVTTVQVKELNSSLTQTNYGFITPKESLIVDVTPRYSGYVERLYANTRYKEVKKGDALVKVYSAEVLRAKEDYLNSLNYHATQPNSAMLKSTRSKLVLLGVSMREIKQIKSKRSVSSYTTIYAPTDGWIFEKTIFEGSAFTKDKQLFQIVNLQSVWVEARLYAQEIEKLDNFEHFTIKSIGVAQKFTAKKLLLYPQFDPKEATITLRLEVNNPKGLLKVGMYTTITASTPTATKLVIPRTAVIRKSGRWYAFLATEFRGEYEPVEIEVEPLDINLYIVTSGLTTADSIVNNALFMMDSDAQISRTYP